MNNIRLRLALCAGLLLSPLAAAQETHTHVEPDGTTKTVQGPQHTIPPAPAAPMPQLPPFDRLAKLGPDGKVIRLEGILDILAIPRNALVDDATRARISPLVQTWMADVDQLAIDNLDFIEKIDPPDGSIGVIETVDINDNKRLLYVAQMMNQLMSAGPLSAHLEAKDGFTREQSALNQQIVSDYLQQVMNEIMAENGVPNNIEQKPQSEADKVKQVNAVSRFLYQISCRDPMNAYYRMLTDAAPVMDRVIAGMSLTPDQASKVKPYLAAAKSAMTSQDKRAATRSILNQLTFDQRRAAMSKARELAPPYDPIAQLPPQQAAGAQDHPATPVGTRGN